MLTKQEMMLDFIGCDNTRLVIPVYQRAYAWNERQCDALWTDTMRAGRNNSTHFIGTLLYASEPTDDDSIELVDIIDGQQRAATLILLIAALRNYLTCNESTLDGLPPQDITCRYLHVTSMENTPKLTLSRFDNPTLDALVESTELPDEDDLSANVLNNYKHFTSKMDEDFTLDDAEMLWNGLRRLMIISAELDTSDSPQLVFESLNSKGMTLTTADLVRNLMLINAGYEEQARLYERYWEPIERMFGDDADSTRLNAALRGWLAITAPRLHVSDTSEVYSVFKTFLEDVYQGTLEDLLIGLKGFCETFVSRSQSRGTSLADAHANWGNAKNQEIIPEKIKRLFGD